MNLLKYIKNPVTSSELLKTVQNVIISNEEELVKVQTQQWSDGKDKEGSIIGEYKPFTENKSKESPFPNKPKIAGQPYNLDWSGDLKKKTYVEPKIKSKDVIIKIDSKGVALNKLFQTIKTYGLIDDPNTIFGYQPKNSNKLTKLINKLSLIKLKNRI